MFLRVSCTDLKKWVSLFCFLAGLVLFPTISFGSYAVIDAHSGRVLYEDQGDLQLPPASITKIWTVYVALQEADVSDQVRISRVASQQEGSSVYLIENEVWSLESLLYGTMLQSGNDAAAAIAEHVAGSEAAFATLMNFYVKKAGVKNTWFMNASGLHHPKHLTTASDMGKLFAIAMNDEKFRQIASMKQYVPKERRVLWMNKHRLVKENKAFAGKTGYTSVAGRTLISEFIKDDKRLIVTTLNVRDDWNSHTSLSRLAFDSTTLQTIEGTYYAQHDVILTVPMPFRYLQKEDESISHTVVLSKQSKVGEWSIQAGGQTLRFPVIYRMK
ncbi:D-alanyl-D-alanine carboxypeptidase family protein [Chryseomicrobium palamuruense]|uniref:D-alanyl-D-alanine carboxypeptidase family protein n=1 Tax=Chryseomicrobium palamuruense TaxID=682973 RepID=A0ABV8UUE8_9BACL